MLARVPRRTDRLAHSICRQCSRVIGRNQSTDAALPQERAPRPITVSVGKDHRPYRLLASVILNRAPILTRIPTPFESAYYEYQRRIARALSNPFPGEFYFKKGSYAERRFAVEEREREIATFGAAARVRALDSEEAKLEEQEIADEKPLPRETEADRTGDVKSLDRKGDRNLYLLVKAAESDLWRFPEGNVMVGEVLHKAALRDLYEECGPDMYSWIVGRQPIGIHTRELPSPSAESSGDKIFFFKAHILSGQARPNSKVGLQDFAWLTKEEIEGRVDAPYWEATRDVLSEL